MSTNITINGTTFAYPDAGDEPGWGEEATGAMVEVATVLNTLQGIDDIPETSFTIANGTATPTDVVGLVFNPSTVRSAVVEYSIYRSTTSPASEYAEKGKLELVYKNGGTIGSKWSVGRLFYGDDAGISFSMTDVGQVQYTSTNLSGTHSGEMKFEAAVTQQ